MTHPREEWLALEATGDLAWWRAALVRRHTTRCAGCQSRVLQYRTLTRELARLPVPEPTVEPAALLPSEVPAWTPALPAFAARSLAAVAGVAAVAAVVMFLPRREPVPAPAVVTSRPLTPEPAVGQTFPPVRPEHKQPAGQAGMPVPLARTLVPQVTSPVQPLDSFLRIQLPPAAPLELVRVDYDGSRMTRSEREIHFDFSLKLTLRNRSSKPVEGVALAMAYGFSNPAVAGSAESLIRPGQSFELPARLRGDIEVPPAGALGRPIELPAHVQLSLDSVLFRDGSAYGPDRLGALAAFRMNRAEAARDRRYLETLAAAGGPAGVARTLEGWAALWERQSEISARALSGSRAEMLRSHATPGRLETVRLPGAPLEIVSAEAYLSEGRVVDPLVEVRNTGHRAVTDFQMFWVFRDAAGNEFCGRSVARPSGAARRPLPPLASGERSAVSEPVVLEASRRNREVEIVSARLFLRAAEFADGQVWVPERAVLDSLGLATFLPPSSYQLSVIRRQSSVAARR